jgi:4-hydroxybenzoate polyprenyltransferase
MKLLLERLRTLLILGRVSNLPTVWSNLLAGLILSTADYDHSNVLSLLFGGTFLYIGGMYLNDFYDVKFDTQYCPERPIPAGKISKGTVGILTIIWFVAGIACLAPLGKIPAIISLLLLGSIVLYDYHHKHVVWAPLLMGFCRFCLYPLAAASAQYFPVDIQRRRPPTGEAAWHATIVESMKLDHALTTVLPAIAIGLYVAGISYLARGESRREKPARWALLLLIAPVIYSLTARLPTFIFLQPLYFSLMLLGWMAWLLVPIWRKTNPSIGRVVSGLLAGIVLVDMIAVAPLIGFQATWFLLLFALALLLQRVIPGT